MKKLIYILIVISVIVISYVSFYNYLPPVSAIKKARMISELKIPKEITIEKYEKENTFTGEGYMEIILIMNKEKLKEFLKKNNLSEFKTLPIKEKLPPLPDEYYSYMNINTFNKYYYDENNTIFKENLSGYYRLKRHKKSESFSIVILDEFQRKILIYAFSD